VRPDISCAAGKIICISSVHEVIPWAGHVNYAASKGGVMLLMKSIAQEVAPWRIRVNSIAPGAIRTPINMQAWDTPEHYAELLKLIPYKRIGEAQEIGRAAAWLANDDSDYIHGVTLFRRRRYDVVSWIRNWRLEIRCRQLFLPTLAQQEPVGRTKLRKV
jgi:glucose 1-dehydrogenase